MAIGERRRLTEEQGRALVRQWRQSRETKAEFCRRRGVGVHVLRYHPRSFKLKFERQNCSTRVVHALLYDLSSKL